MKAVYIGPPSLIVSLTIVIRDDLMLEEIAHLWDAISSPMTLLFLHTNLTSLYTHTHIYIYTWASLMTNTVKNPPAMQETWVWSLGQEDPLEEGTATHSSILAWRIPWTEELGGLQSMGSQRVGHDWATKHSAMEAAGDRLFPAHLPTRQQAAQH